MAPICFVISPAVSDIPRDAGFEMVDPQGDFSLTREQLQPFLGGIDALIAGGETNVTRSVPARPETGVIARTGVGYDLIDVDAASSHRMAVTITPGTNQDSVAEQTWALLLAMPGESCHNDRVIHGGGWDQRWSSRCVARPLAWWGWDASVGRWRCGPGISGSSRRVRYHRRRRIRPAARNQTSVARRAPGISDFVSLHVPLTETTRGMVNREFLAKMQPGSYLINTARGRPGRGIRPPRRPAVGTPSGAGLDVMSKEPPDADCPLIGVPT